MKKTLLLCFVLVSFLFNQAFTQTVTKFAGTPETANTTQLSTNAVGRDVALFNQPYGIAIDGNGQIWVSDRLNHCIRMIKKEDNLIYMRAGYSQGYKNATGITSQFDNPMGLAIGPNNEIYVADNGNYCIRKITAFLGVSNPQTITTFAGKLIGGYPSQGFADGTSSQAMFNSPTDIAVDASGNLYITDAGNHAIRKITPAGDVSTIAGGPSKGGYLDGTLANAKFNYPTGIFVTSAGDIYVADHNNQKVRKISGNNVTTVAITGLWSPDDVIVTSNGDLYITDQHKIVKYSGTTTSIFAGSTTPNTSGYANGVGNSALFYNVKCMMLKSSDNSLYVADMDNHIIRNITLSIASNPPKCAFTANKTTVVKTGSVTFTDQSTNSPTSRKWTFTGGSPSTSTVASPVVTYATAGSYAVKLEVSNADGTDSLTKSAYITVTNTIGIKDEGNSNLKIYPSPATDILYLNSGNIDLSNSIIMISSLNGQNNYAVDYSLQQTGLISIPVSNLQSGIYVLTVKTDKDCYRLRFIRQ